MSDKDDLKDDLEAFKRASDFEADQRKEALDMLKFVKLGEQWPSAVKTQRDQEGRPCLVINRLPAFGKQVTNDARQNRPMIKCHPIGEKADRETAEIYNGLIRNIEYTSNADVAYDTALDFAVNCGIGYTTVDINYACDDSFDKDIRICRVDNPFAIFGDPDSKAADSSDWNRAFAIQKMTQDEFERRWPGAKSTGFDANKSNAGWFSDDKIQVAEAWTRIKVPGILIKLSDGSIMMEPEYLKIKDLMDIQGVAVSGTRETQVYQVGQRIITGHEVLEKNPWPGRYIPIIPCYGDEVNVDGKRSFQSLFHFAKDAQRNYNYHRSMITELGALAPKTPFIGPEEAFKGTDADKWATANNQAHAYIGYKGNTAPQRQGFAGPPAGVMQEALAASDDMKTIMGLYDASLGAKSNETSGRAILARQREGDVSTFNFIDNQSRMIRHLGLILVDLIPKVYDVPRIVRVIKEDGTNYGVPINQPVQVIQKPPQPGQTNTPEYRPVDPNNPPMQGGAQVPQLSDDEHEDIAGLIKTFDLAAGKYDVTCESGPSFTTRREEAAAQMMQFIQANPQSAPLIGDLLAKSLDWPGAEEIAKRLQAMLPPQAQQGAKPPQLAQAEDAITQLKGQLQQAGQALNEKQTETQFKQADLQLRSQELQLKAQEAQTKQFDSETKRIQVMADAQQNPPEPPPDNTFEAWRLEAQASFDRWKTEYTEQQTNMRKQMDIEAAERMELLKQQHPEIVSQELAEPEEEYDPETGELIERQAPVDPLEKLAIMHAQLIAQMGAPKMILRDENGRAHGLIQQPLMPEPDGCGQ